MRLLPMFLFAVMLVAGACSTTKGTAPSTTAGAGVVPADMRDVEREGEGLVTTTFGDAPARTPDWGRAASVLDLLKQVWGRAKAASSGLPAAQVKAIDDAIVTLDQAIPAKDQQRAVYAANAVGLACPELFAFFHSDAPAGILRMDAVFRQVGMDGRYKSFAEARKDIDALKADWASTKDAVAQRVPTCHRVGGTATVATDIEASLANLDKAIAANDTPTLEQESDNGALEVDTLERLFDCPADNIAPARGLGARCTTDANCDKGQACDLANAGGKCAPDSSNKIGTPCTTTVDCGSDSRAACNNASGDGFPGGYCFMEPCDDVQVCPAGATCVAPGSEVPGCFKTCAKDEDCRVAEGYVCQLFVTQAPIGFGPSDRACGFPCKRDVDCQKPLTCDVSSGKCKP